MKKIICLSAAASLIAALAIGAGAAGEEKIVLKSSDDTLAVGDTLTVTIAVENFENFNTAMFYDVEYDENYLQWTGGSWLLEGGTLSDYVRDSKVTDNGEQGRSGVYYTDDSELSGTIDIATMEFTVLKESAEAQTVGCSVILKNGTADYGNAELETEVALSEVKPALNYTFGQNAQIKLIEPWGLKANAKVSVDGQVVDYNSLYDYGVYFIRASELDTEGLTQDTIVPEDIVNNENAVLYTKNNGIEISSGYLGAIYQKDLYTYEFSDAVFVMYYIVAEEGDAPVYAPIRERNLSELVNSRMNNNTFSEKERAVYQDMAVLETNIIDYRSGFSNLTKPVMQSIPTCEEYQIEGVLAENIYSFSHNVQIKLVEPWGMRLNGKVSNGGTVIDYSAMKEYGFIVLPDADAAGYSSSELLSCKDAYVFSSKNGDVMINNGYISADYFKDIYTYQLNTNVYVMYYVVDATGNIYCGPVKERNLYSLMAERAVSTSTAYSEKEKAVYSSMVDLYESITDYRSDFLN